MKYHESWSALAIKSFEEAILTHGGWSAWDNFDNVTLKLKEFRGLLPFVKGLSKTFNGPKEMSVNPKLRKVDFDYGTHKDTFQNGRLIYSQEKIEIADGRKIFKRSNFEKWYPQHSLYFFGYAWANYIGYPFILPPFELLKWQTNNSCSKFKIRFPRDFHTHCRVQTFYFDSKHLLYRHDYHADFAGPIFYAAHYTENYRQHRGLSIACVRKVRPRLGGVVFPIHGIYAELDL